MGGNLSISSKLPPNVFNRLLLKPPWDRILRKLLEPRSKNPNEILSNTRLIYFANQVKCNFSSLMNIS